MSILSILFKFAYANEFAMGNWKKGEQKVGYKSVGECVNFAIMLLNVYCN